MKEAIFTGSSDLAFGQGSSVFFCATVFGLGGENNDSKKGFGTWSTQNNATTSKKIKKHNFYRIL